MAEALPSGPDVGPPGSYHPVNGWPVKSDLRNWDDEHNVVVVLNERYMEESVRYDSFA